ncbi:hypothetical protein WMY93_031936, partial [Mugilogobius chulae]
LVLLPFDRRQKVREVFPCFLRPDETGSTEIKATVTVNTSDLGNRKRDEEGGDKEAPAKGK